MALTLYNTAAREKQIFVPLRPGRVGMYVCGPTVYDYAHIGNARPVVVFDVLYRLLKREYASVNYVRNITDVDDKINAAAKDAGEPIGAITARTTQAFHEDMAALNTLPPDDEPRATEHVPDMIEMIQSLIERKHSYEVEGHVLFHVPSMPDYGRLSGRSVREMIAGARVEVAPFKRDPADFVLWKPSTPDLPGWPSPWGRGRPGWHIECSVMSTKILGPSFDIHGGGRDLIFPHHENEVAQSRCADPDEEFANFWVHNGFVTVEGEKMSKSVGNIVTVRELLAEFPGEAIRLALLSAHYRQPLDFTRQGLREAKHTLDRWYRAVDDVAANIEMPEGVMAALDDDLNTPRAIAALHGMTGDPRELRAGAEILGLLQQDTGAWLKGRAISDAEVTDGVTVTPLPATAGASAGGAGVLIQTSEARVEELVGKRVIARVAKDFATSDRIRDELAAQGIVLEDKPDGTTEWRRA
jgi:cysteinyl-tRNA synthetase